MWLPSPLEFEISRTNSVPAGDEAGHCARRSGDGAGDDISPEEHLSRGLSPLSPPDPSRGGQSLFQKPAAYEYLADSIMNFPDPEAFATLMEEAGLVHVEKYPLDFGITYLHIGVKPNPY